MISYAKIWTTIFNDSWFLSLNCQQRGLWLQIIVYAKSQGDVSRFFYRSCTAFAQLMGMDRSVMAHSLRKYQLEGRLYIVLEKGKPLEIDILNYSYWQGLKDDKAWRKNSNNVDDISSTNNNKNNNKNINNNIYSSDVSNIPYKEIIEHLNLCAKTNYKYRSKKTQSLIKARWNEGYRFEDFKYVHSVKMEQWMNSDMEKYMRPETLYSNKFESYREQKPKSKISQMPDWQRKNAEVMKRKLGELND